MALWLVTEVQRNDELQLRDRETEKEFHAVILEALKVVPSMELTAPLTMSPGQDYNIAIRVKGLGENDEVYDPPMVTLFNRDSVFLTLNYPIDIIDSIVHGATGERLYSFQLRAPRMPGAYRLHVAAATNHIMYSAESNSVKLGALEYPIDTFMDIISGLGTMPELIHIADPSVQDSVGKVSADYIFNVR